MMIDFMTLLLCEPWRGQSGGPWEIYLDAGKSLGSCDTCSQGLEKSVSQRIKTKIKIFRTLLKDTR